MDTLKQAELQGFRAKLSLELHDRGWKLIGGSVYGSRRYIHPVDGMIEEKSLLSAPLIRGVDVSAVADELENAAKQRHAEMIEDADADADDPYDPLEEFRIGLEDRGMTTLDIFAAVLGDELFSRKISAAIEILGSLDRDKLGDSFDNTCGAILMALAYMLADPSQKT